MYKGNSCEGLVRVANSVCTEQYLLLAYQVYKIITVIRIWYDYYEVVSICTYLDTLVKCLCLNSGDISELVFSVFLNLMEMSKMQGASSYLSVILLLTNIYWGFLWCQGHNYMLKISLNLMEKQAQCLNWIAGRASLWKNLPTNSLKSSSIGKKVSPLLDSLQAVTLGWWIGYGRSDVSFKL